MLSGILNIGRLHCPVEYQQEELFFSLVDYRNNYFTSDNANKIIEFYNGFRCRDQLIRGMKERPKGVAKIHEVDGNKDIIVVIPTADFNGKYSKECRENIFKGLHMVFVESGGRGDLYFNYAHNCNVGIKKAMEYNPKWVVVSNDDIIKLDSVEVLIKGLKSINNEKYCSVFTKQSKYHSMSQRIAVPRKTFFSMFLIAKRVYLNLKGLRSYYDVEKSIISKFPAEIRQVSNSIFETVLYKTLYSFTLTGDFTILSDYFLAKGKISAFDETYINGFEDTDLFYTLEKRNKYTFVNFNIGAYSSGTLRYDKLRDFKGLANLIYFNYKFRKEF